MSRTNDNVKANLIFKFMHYNDNNITKRKHNISVPLARDLNMIIKMVNIWFKGYIYIPFWGNFFLLLFLSAICFLNVVSVTFYRKKNSSYNV